MSSLLEVSAADRMNKVYSCKAGYKPNEIVTVEWQNLQPQPPKLSSLVPSREMIHSQANAVLGCVISGFSPDNVEVSWKKAGSAQEGIVLPSTRRSNGTFETIAYLTLPVQEWTKKQKYTCEVNHAPSGFSGQVNMMYQEDECSDTHPSVTLSKPSFEEIWTKRTATILCEVVHSDLLGSSVTWQVDGRKRDDGVRTLGPDSNGGEDMITSRLTVPAAEWNSGAEFSCVIEEKSLPTPVKKSIWQNTDVVLTRPHVYLLPPSSDEVDTDQTVTLMCLVTKFSPAEIYVAWMANDTLLKTGFVNQPVTKDPRNGWNTMTSQLKVSPEEWKSGTTFSCVVGHESLTTNLFRSINKSHSKPTLVNLSFVLTDSFKSCV